MATIEVLKIKPIAKGSLRAFVSVKLGGVTVHDCRIVQQDGQNAWVSMPTREYQGQDGKKKYAPIVELSDTLKAEVNRVVLLAWEKNTSHDAEEF